MLVFVCRPALRQLLNRRIDTKFTHVLKEPLEEPLGPHLPFTAKSPITSEDLPFSRREQRRIALVSLTRRAGRVELLHPLIEKLFLVLGNW
jgi:hypothetical protein